MLSFTSSDQSTHETWDCTLEQIPKSLFEVYSRLSSSLVVKAEVLSIDTKSYPLLLFIMYPFWNVLVIERSQTLAGRLFYQSRSLDLNHTNLCHTFVPLNRLTINSLKIMLDNHHKLTCDGVVKTSELHLADDNIEKSTGQ